MPLNVQAPLRTAKQLFDKDGTPHKSVLTSNLWVGSATVFSRPTGDNKVVAFTTGKEYFADLITSCDAATQEIYILGWQVNWDALLAPGVRLYDVLLRAARRGVKIYVMPWDDTNPVQTYDDQTKTMLESINGRSGVTGKPVTVLIAKSFASKNNSYFSHHQKQVIIDQKIAYIGGMDLAYGRYDDATYDLHADKDGRQVLNRYNGCVAWVQPISEKDPNVIDPDDLIGVVDNAKIPFGGKSNAEAVADKAEYGAWQIPYADPGEWNMIENRNWGVKNSASSNSLLESNKPDRHTLDPAKQPRMPWQDMHSRIEGPAISDLLRNFVVRWNACQGKRLDMPKPPASYAKAGNAFIQVLRSAPAAMGQAEYNALPSRTNVKAPAGTENDIHRAMVQLIEKSRNFIYIENQFFVSAFGSIGGPQGPLSPAAQFINSYGGSDQNKTASSVLGSIDDDSHLKVGRNGWKPSVSVDDSALHKPPTNQVCEALIARIQRSILDVKRPKFHVYVTVPVHPEGLLSKASIAVQVYWTMQTLVFGSMSLLNGIRRAIKVRELMDKDDLDYLCRDHSDILNDKANTEYESVPIEKCFEYVTLLNLRNWAKLPGSKAGDERYVTEQIYVHTKLMIVDDLYALYGSANINDRSLLGERDSEIAVLVMDGDDSRADVCGKGSQRPVRKFAHELRMNVWKKLFGISGGVRPARDLLSAIEAPGIPDSWRRIQAQAEKNAAAYEAVFSFVPRSWSGRRLDDGTAETGSILPTWNRDINAPPKASWGAKGNLVSPLPFQSEFWSLARHNTSAVNQLESIRGFITALPIHWTENENIKFDYPTALVAENSPSENHFPEGALLKEVDV
ncbi:MAG: Phospholipase D/Transphosphatidylase [Rhodocyclales bacterium]|nr:Phospholipase D/Transphosphatidylase [Rhodocyclales bacterium]